MLQARFYNTGKYYEISHRESLNSSNLVDDKTSVRKVDYTFR